MAGKHWSMRWSSRSLWITVYVLESCCFASKRASPNPSISCSFCTSLYWISFIVSSVPCFMTISSIYLSLSSHIVLAFLASISTYRSLFSLSFLIVSTLSTTYLCFLCREVYLRVSLLSSGGSMFGWESSCSWTSSSLSASQASINYSKEYLLAILLIFSLRAVRDCSFTSSWDCRRTIEAFLLDT